MSSDTGNRIREYVIQLTSNFCILKCICQACLPDRLCMDKKDKIIRSVISLGKYDANFLKFPTYQSGFGELCKKVIESEIHFSWKKLHMSNILLIKVYFHNS